MNQRRFAAIAAVFLTGALFAVLADSPTARAAGQDEANRLSLSLFSGNAGTDSNVSLSGWGSGDAYATKEVVLVGDSSIRVTTHGLYQGARVDFKEPVDLSAAFSNPKAYMRFQFRFSGNDAVRSGFSERSFQNTRQAVSPFKQMRFLLVMADGSKHELVRPIEVPPSDDPDQWVAIAFPFAAIVKQNNSVPTGEGTRIKQLVIAGDKYQQFYIGEIRVITDATELSVAPLDEQIFFAQQPAQFVGNAEGGTSTLRYSWDFDASDGIQEDATGRSVVYTFPTSNAKDGIKKYIVTLTVSDYDNLKKPVSVTMEAEVTD